MKHFPAFLLLGSLVACTAEQEPAPATDAGESNPPSHLSSADQLPEESPRFVPDEAWTVVPLTSEMRLHHFRAPGAGEGLAPADVVVAAWPHDVGGLESNLTRWINQSGMTLTVADLTEEQLSRKSVRGFEVSILRLDGGGTGSGETDDAHGAAGQPMTVAYIEKPGHPGVWTVKLTGPIETIQAHGAAFDAFLDRL